MTKLSEQILELRSKNFSFREIQTKLGCSKSTISYHCSLGQKNKTSERKKKIHPFYKKIESYCMVHNPEDSKNYLHGWKKILQLKIESFCMTKDRKYVKPSFTVDDVITKFGEKPVCYLTGRQLDILDSRSIHFDHKIPRSRGGENTIENLGLCCPEANRAKSDMTPKEFIEFCKEVVRNN